MSLAKNTSFKIGNGGGEETFAQITGVTELSWSGVSWSTETTTSHDNATPVETLAPTIYSNGTWDLTVLFSPINTQHAQLRTLSTSGAFNNFQVEHVNSGEEMQFSGFVSAFTFDTPVDGLVKANVTITVNGAMTSVA